MPDDASMIGGRRPLHALEMQGHRDIVPHLLRLGRTGELAIGIAHDVSTDVTWHTPRSRMQEIQVARRLIDGNAHLRRMVRGDVIAL